MNYPFATAPPYIQAAMAQAVQAMMSGGPLPPNCLVMSLPYQAGQPVFPSMMMAPQANAGQDPMIYSQGATIYGPSALGAYNNPAAPRAIVPFTRQTPPVYNYGSLSHRTKGKSKNKMSSQPHSNIYNSSSFDTYMRDLSWSRLFDHPQRKNSKQSTQDASTTQNDEKSNSSKKQRSNSGNSSTSSTTSDETIRRVNVANQATASNIPPKGTTKGSLPFKYSSEFIPGIGKQQSQKVKSNEGSNVKKA